MILENPAFEHYLLEKEPSDVLDNVSRAILEDQNKYLVGCNKSRKDSSVRQHTETEKGFFYSLPGLGHESFRNITYSLFNDSRGYLWIGSKGYGLSVINKTA